MFHANKKIGCNVRGRKIINQVMMEVLLYEKKKKEEGKAKKSDCNVLKVKLGILVITWFHGTLISTGSGSGFDMSSLPSQSFSYPKELDCHKVRLS